jgi:1L-myo-inositol 1-phosphate cytidylyltransferase / CDP-L-myo-inositol myo-inositolphosphotransferase
VSSPLPDRALPPGSSAAVPVAPILILVPTLVPSSYAQGFAKADGGDLQILGLGLARRTVLTALRTGFRPVFLLTPGDATLPGVASVADWGHLYSALLPGEAALLLIAPTTILAETGWLEQLAGASIEPVAWAAAPDRIVMLSAATLPEALVALDAEGGARDMAAVECRLTRRFGSPARLPDSVAPMTVSAPADIRIAERRLLRALVKDTDGFMARHVERPISLTISRHLASTVVTPNQMTLVSMAIGLAGAPFFLSAHGSWQITGALLFLAHSILDGCDGELARLKFQESRSGGVLDFWSDNIVHIVTFACMAIGWSRGIDQAWPLLLGAAAVLGNAGSAGLVYWRMMRTKEDAGPLYTSVSALPDRSLAKLLDALSRRDFIYLVVALALFGKANWFLLLASLGAPTYFFLLVLLAIRERVTGTRTPSRA